MTSQIQQPSYSIGVVARLTGVSTHSLRMWERRYGLGASKRTKGGQREFTKVDLEHIKLIKNLLDEGLKIGDIAKLPQKTLSGLSQKRNDRINKNISSTVYQTVVIGSGFSIIFNEHALRYPQLAIEFPAIAVEQWLQENSENCDKSICFFQIEHLQKSLLPTVENLKKTGATVVIHYQLSSPDVTSSLSQAGAVLISDEVNQQTVDSLVKKALNEQQYSSALFRSAEQYNLPLADYSPPVFTPAELEKTRKEKKHLQCECPTHLADLITALNSFEQYSLDCESTNWQEAAIHACIYAYTVQARDLMERALMAALSEDPGDEPK